jgi:hypothetical protein
VAAFSYEGGFDNITLIMRGVFVVWLAVKLAEFVRNTARNSGLFRHPPVVPVPHPF